MLELTKEQMKKAEALTDRAGLSYLEMMYNAGIKAFEYINTQFDLQSLKTVILCGNGNNGGDGFVVAKKMIDNGYNVITVLCSGAPKTKEAQKVFELIPESIDFLENQSLVVSALADADIVIDAVYGTGFRGELSEELDVLFNYANGNTCERISLDLPSGMNADTGEIFKNYFHADITITFGAYKLCHNLPECKSKCGRVVLVDIGIPMDIMFIAQNELKLIDKELVSSVLPKRSAKSHKGNYGNLLNICGSNNMGGAAMMVTLSAMRMGVGKTTLASTKCVIDRCCGNMMEAMTISLPQNSNGEIQSESIAVLNKSLKQSTACLIGCGLGCSKNTREIVEYVIDNADCPIILDADALNVISQDLTILNNLKTPAVITPHIGEMARLSALTIEEVQKSSMSIAKQFALEHNVTVVLKNYRTLIVTPKGEIFQNTTGNAALAKGGSGDVLAGMIASLIAQGISCKDAALAAIYIHGYCADRLVQRMSQYSVLARDLIEEIPFALKEVVL